jgi:voltage-gated potassium channel
MMSRCDMKGLVMVPRPKLIGLQKPGKLWRYTRAVWRDTLALWSEFRIPILLFLVIAIGGGYLYGELHAYSGAGDIALIDRPYVIMQLMIVAAPDEAPAEWYLIAFWYTLPFVLVFIAGLGIADFVHLFLNPNERRDGWREAVASTYRNHVIVLGAGHVGLRVIRALVSMGREVVVMDNDPDPGVEDTLSELNVPLVVGDGRASSVMEKAGLQHAESLVICTGDDYVNLKAVMKVRDMNPNVRIVARMWDDRYAEQIARFMDVQTILSSSDLAAPQFAGAALGIEITQTLEVNGEEYSMLRLTVESGSFMDGETVGNLQTDGEMDIVLYGRGDESEVQPSRELVVQAGDTLVIFAQHERVLDVVARNRPNVRRRRFLR